MPKLRVLLVADQESKYIWDYFDKKNFEGVELIISCGDLRPAYLSFLTTMVAAPLYYVHGNHDGSYLRTPPEGCECLEDKILDFKGFRFLGFGGVKATSPKPFHYSEKEVNRQILRRMGQICFHGGFDVLVTHAPAAGLGDGDDDFHRGFNCYRALNEYFNPAYHFYGHQHLNYGNSSRVIQHGNTKLINGFGYQIIDLEMEEKKRSKLSYLITCYEWGRRNATGV